MISIKNVSDVTVHIENLNGDRIFSIRPGQTKRYAQKGTWFAVTEADTQGEVEVMDLGEGP